LSPQLQQRVTYAGTNNTSFKQGSEDLARLFDFDINPKQVERVTRRIGQERRAARDEAVANYMNLPLVDRKDKPQGVETPQVAVIGVDGGRLQIRNDSWPSASKEAKAATAQGQEQEEEALPPDDKHRGKHWREDKIGLLMTMTSEEHPSDPCPEVPQAFVDPLRIVKLTRELKVKKSAATAAGAGEAAGEGPTPEEAEQALYEAGQPGKWQPPEVKDKHLTATRQPWKAFGPMVAQSAWELGFYQAQRKAFLADGSDNNWALWRKHCSSFEPILDIIHAISYVFASATAGRPFAEGWPCYVRWLSRVWQGEVSEVIEELGQRQAELGDPQGGDGETHPRAVVATALGYLRNHRGKMRYWNRR
jgi:hypothetical protein